jgi:hypothetical protein
VVYYALQPASPPSAVAPLHYDAHRTAPPPHPLPVLARARLVLPSLMYAHHPCNETNRLDSTVPLSPLLAGSRDTEIQSGNPGCHGRRSTQAHQSDKDPKQYEVPWINFIWVEDGLDEECDEFFSYFWCSNARNPEKYLLVMTMILSLIMPFENMICYVRTNATGTIIVEMDTVAALPGISIVLQIKNYSRLYLCNASMMFNP